MTTSLSPAFALPDTRRLMTGGAWRRWRRHGAALGVVLCLHAGLIWVLAVRVSGGETRAAAFDLTFDDPLAIPVGLQPASPSDASSGGLAATGERVSDEPPDAGAGDGTGGGKGEARAAETRGVEAAKVAVERGAAEENRMGQGDPFAAGPPGPPANNAYQRLLLRHIRPFRLYPAEAVPRRAEGVVVVRFRISRDGAVEEAWVVERSRDPALDRAALETLWRAEPMPAVPDELPAPIEVELPVPFRLPGR